VVAEAGAKLDRDVVARQWDAMVAWDEGGVADRLGEIGCPALVATGTEDQICAPENATLLAAALRDSWLARFPAAGHAFMADHPVALAGLIGDFVAAHK
jgi:pimeloyl-ACP methyl ester carboxylesterase